MSINNLAVVGGGLMGAGITQNAAESGKKVTLVEVSEELGDQSIQSIKKRLNRNVEKGRMSETEKEQALNNISVKVGLENIAQADLVIEAVPEELEIKKKVFRQLDEYAKKDAIIASNTSGLSIAAIGAATKRPEQVIGFHFFYPVPLMKLIEVTPSIITAEEIVNKMHAFAEEINKTPVHCNDYPGFLVNRLLIPMVNEAVYCVMEGSSPEDVDQAMQLGANHKMGPITLADFVGLEVLLATMEGLYNGFSDSKYRPCPLLKKLVESGNYGVKTGRGFYYYDENGQQLNAAL
ncbi:3-hydroxybutyryl-CoA dehydrogenase [Salibacterium salarium]|uniref:3-hydroxybutyryl-CoA dehydrogenase n=1 Tax=Salibacterium salarium TaxID=284579 RepID=A0A3R9P605_9BACI|nr:3-hydroxyacyl-CoA dehydrogenase NAD-binding domain-containing protein [Salibacterium salarium]RSL33559.1 3-hydroxybutyryl-CoA dehydrogenase [Salibacterium salarium]